MTYGRPTMTAHLPDLPVPSTAGFAESLRPPQPQAGGGEIPSKLSYYVEYIKQCRILGEILSNVYQPSAGAPASGPQPWPDQKPHGMDAILELDAKLSRYEAALPPIMSWMSPCDISNLDEDRRSVITAQRTVLRGRQAPRLPPFSGHTNIPQLPLPTTHAPPPDSHATLRRGWSEPFSRAELANAARGRISRSRIVHVIRGGVC